jgi:hypothetical protein
MFYKEISFICNILILSLILIYLICLKYLTLSYHKTDIKWHQFCPYLKTLGCNVITECKKVECMDGDGTRRQKIHAKFREN